MNAILAEARRRGITRLCHFTKSGNLANIIVTGEIRATADLRQSHDAYRPTDENRRDGRLGDVCCSVEYPNAWYWQKVRASDENFPDWVALTLDLALLATPGAAFCPHNAARRGAVIREGLDGFAALFALGRGRRHPDWAPTQDQAEVLVPGPIPLSAVRSVIVKDEAQANQDGRRLDYLGIPRPPFVIAPDLFDPAVLSRTVRAGRRPEERHHVVAG